MVKERILAVPYTTVFIAQLPKETQDIIREDMKLHARETDTAWNGMPKPGIILE